MNWKAWLAIVILVIGAFAAWSIYNKRKWIEKDVALQVQIAKLLEQSELHSKEAEKLSNKSAEAEKTALEAMEAREALEDELVRLRTRVRKRPVASTQGQLRGQLEDCDALSFKLEEDLALADDTIKAYQASLVSSRSSESLLRLQVADLSKARELEHERVDVWQQQTRRGRVKTAFLAIGSATAGGFAGYGIGRAIQ